MARRPFFTNNIFLYCNLLSRPHYSLWNYCIIVGWLLNFITEILCVIWNRKYLPEGHMLVSPDLTNHVTLHSDISASFKQRCVSHSFNVP